MHGSLSANLHAYKKCEVVAEGIKVVLLDQPDMHPVLTSCTTATRVLALQQAVQVLGKPGRRGNCHYCGWTGDTSAMANFDTTSTYDSHQRRIKASRQAIARRDL
eukprot:1882178-Amphidinium_carterae.1